MTRPDICNFAALAVILALLALALVAFGGDGVGVSR